MEVLLTINMTLNKRALLKLKQVTPLSARKSLPLAAGDQLKPLHGAQENGRFCWNPPL